MRCILCKHNVRTYGDERLYFKNTGAYSPAYYYQQGELDDEDMEKYGLSEDDWNHYLCSDCLFDIQDAKNNSNIPLNWVIRLGK